MHAHILLKSDRGQHGSAWSDAQIQQVFGVGESTLKRVRQRLVEQGLADTLERRPQSPRPEKRILNGRHEAYLIALSCGEKPLGRERWSVRLLAHKMVEIGYVEKEFDSFRIICPFLNNSVCANRTFIISMPYKWIEQFFQMTARRMSAAPLTGSHAYSYHANHQFTLPS